jgi:hypothetical protein
LERAFQLATSGRCTSVSDIKKHLAAEGFSADELYDRAIGKQLIAHIRSALIRRRTSSSGKE